MAIRSIKGNVDKAKGLAKTAYDQGFLDGKEIGKPGVEMILNSSPKAQAKRRKTKQKKAIGEIGGGKMGTGYTKKMGGGKIYASTDKKYGGGIYPRKPTNG